MDTIEVNDLGPIKEAKIDFGDLTILVGPQATGKSLIAQLTKLLEDAPSVRHTLKQYGFFWSKDRALLDFLSLYLGSGMEGILKPTSRIRVDGKDFKLDSLVDGRGHKPTLSEDDSVFLIPAQRVLVLQDGWPRPFMGYSPGDPYCIRSFSESLRRLMEQGLGRGTVIFPQSGRLKADLRHQIDKTIYTGGKVDLDVSGMRKRIVLRPAGTTTNLPYNVWSAGQREFTPLLMGMYWLMPPTNVKQKRQVQTVIVEEPEMGLHPDAIVTFCLLVLELLWREYRVILSTHSPAILDVVWAMQELAALEDPDAAMAALKKIFGIERLAPPIRAVFEAALKKVYRVYFFDRRAAGVTVQDISTLDPGSEDDHISGWGGLSGFSGRVATAVGDALTQAEEG